MVWVVNGSPGTQWSGVPSQSKATLRALSGVCSDAIAAGAGRECCLCCV